LKMRERRWTPSRVSWTASTRSSGSFRGAGS
jgi:hypothetical protein